MLRLAHRGDWRRAPENTLEALTAAMAVPGCDGVELDVRLSADGVPVLIHDDTLHRVHRRNARVDELTVEELEASGVPRLADGLRTLPPDAFLDIELKGEDHREATAAVLRAARGDRPTRAVVSSFEPPTLAAMADLLPGWPRWLNAMDLHPETISLAVGLGCHAISVLWGAITPAALRPVGAAGLEVAAWSVTRRATFERLARLGVVAACVEGPALDG
jgi:glycerophosphoryl diester phosphodiesterase